MQAGYSLVHTAQRLSGTCFKAALFLSILTGEIREDAYLQSRSVLQSLLEFQVAAGECHLDFCECAIFVLRYGSQCSLLLSLQEAQCRHLMPRHAEKYGTGVSITGDQTKEVLHLLLPTCSSADIATMIPNGDSIALLEIVGSSDR